ncbi:MAG TPA: STAS domain-containing protein [Kineosporiaceae bacterium]|nr:STAS domain-containing protein [Kineosporiaceae bacterium]
MERELDVRVIRPGAEVDLVGRLDVRTASMVRETLQACVDEGEGDLLLHVGSLEIWDSAGLGVLVGVHRRARRAGRRIVLTDVPPRHLRLLRATRLHRLFVVEPVVA